MLREITKLLAERHRMSLGELSLHFHVDKRALEPMLDTLIRKGRIQKVDMAGALGCPGCRGCCAPDEPDVVFYETTAGAQAESPPTCAHAAGPIKRLTPHAQPFASTSLGTSGGTSGGDSGGDSGGGVALSLGLVHLRPRRAGAGLHHVYEAVEEVAGIVRAGAGFGVVLHSKDRHVPMAKTFQRAIVEIDVRRLTPSPRQAVGINRKTMVLTGDLNLFCVQVLHRLIAATMTELQLERLGLE